VRTDRIRKNYQLEDERRSDIIAGWLLTALWLLDGETTKRRFTRRLIWLSIAISSVVLFISPLKGE
jgi:hypothetical protein